jgi:carboxypeptidase Taq
MGKKIDEFRERLGEVYDLNAASSVLGWDQQVNMPPGGAEERSSQLATLGALAHTKFTSDAMMEALAAAREEAKALDPDSDEARLVSETGRDIEKERKVPSEWVSRFAKVTSLAQQTWQKARAEVDFAAFAPKLEEVFGLRREYADFFKPYDHIYDPLLDDFEPGMKAAQVDEIFSELRDQQVELVQAIADTGLADDSLLHQQFPIDKQWAFGEEVIKDFGYDFDRGRQDKSAHPFTTTFGIGDVRITTRFEDDFISPALFATLHEAGHAMYEQGIKQDLSRTPLADGTSLGIHESQSRLWENLVGRSRPFWQHYYPALQQTFPEQLGEVDLDSFFLAVNTVEPSLIRVEADEATYNLHIMLRFELEKALMEDTLAIKDLPAAWNDKMQEYLGVTPPNDADGVMQDIHWSAGLVGYFPTYSLGNLIACQWWEVIRRDIPEIEGQIGSGEFGPLLGWLRENIHQHGSKFKPNELIERITGESLTAAPYLRYLKDKFSQIYGLS